jgi:hypothetical protein
VRRGFIALACFASLSCGHAVTPSKPAETARSLRPALPSSAIDAKLDAEWQKRGITPSAAVDDARFARRATIDIAGTLPSEERVSAFLADGSKDKRAKLVDELLASPAYADHWTAYWDEELMGTVRRGNLDRAAFRAWLHGAFERNVPWDELTRSLLTASGENRVDGAVNYFLRFQDSPQDLAGSASRTFLGVQIQCAQCHDHKTEAWKQTDFQKFAAAFMRAQMLPLDSGKEMGPRRMVVRDIDRPLPRYSKNPDLVPLAKSKPTALDGTALEGNPRQAVAAWITKSPSFSRAIVNRVWGHFLGRGFVDPVDDLRPSNPAQMPELLDALAADFAAQGFDLKKLIRTVVLTRGYQLSATPPAGADASREIALWSRFRLAPLGPEELLNAVLAATGTEDALRRGGRIDVDALKDRLRALFTFVFDVDEDTDKADYQGTITQALVMLNGKLTAGGVSGAPGTFIARLARSRATDAEKVDALYLRTLSRKPTSSERDAALAYLADAPVADSAPPSAKNEKKPGRDPLARVGARLAPPPGQDPKLTAYEDLMWALINSSEFVFNH